MSNTRLALLVITALALLVIFGRSPMDEVRKKRAERQSKKLVEKIEEANKKRKSGFGMGTTTRLRGDGETVENPSASPGANPRTGGAPSNQYNNPYNNSPNPFVRPQPQNPSRDDYYPPPVRTDGLGPRSSLKGVPAINFNADPNFTTDNGENLAFFGTKVYTFTQDGEQRPLPDGKYSMYGGRWTMVIRGGSQTIANGDSGGWQY